MISVYDGDQLVKRLGKGLAVCNRPKPHATATLGTERQDTPTDDHELPRIVLDKGKANGTANGSSQVETDNQQE